MEDLIENLYLNTKMRLLKEVSIVILSFRTPYVNEIWKYNQGKLISKIIQNRDNKPKSEYEFTYNENGYVKETKFFITNSLGERIRLEERKDFKYDNNGNVTDENIYEPTGQPVINPNIPSEPSEINTKKYTYEYKYDDQNNWIERVWKIHDLKKETLKIKITEREIFYDDGMHKSRKKRKKKMN